MGAMLFQTVLTAVYAAVRMLLGIEMARSAGRVTMELSSFISAGWNSSNRVLPAEKTIFIKLASNVALLFPKVSLEKQNAAPLTE